MPEAIDIIGRFILFFVYRIKAVQSKLLSRPGYILRLSHVISSIALTTWAATEDLMAGKEGSLVFCVSLIREILI